MCELLDLSTVDHEVRYWKAYLPPPNLVKPPRGCRRKKMFNILMKQAGGSGRAGRNCSGVTVVETLAVIAIVMILIGLALPGLSGVRHRARDLDSLSRVRQLSALVVAYASDNDDRVPAIFPPVYVEPKEPVEWLEAEVGGVTMRGAWFTNGRQGLYALTPPPPAGVLRAPGAPDVEAIIVDGEPTSHFIDYKIADCFYAIPTYWHDDDRQRGPDQWKAQAISDVRYPSDKGFMFQDVVYDPRSMNAQGRDSLGSFRERKVPVIWGDMSGSYERVWSLRKGVLNRFLHSPGIRQLVLNPHMLDGGPPIDNTEDGIAGRDR